MLMKLFVRSLVREEGEYLKFIEILYLFINFFDVLMF